MKEKSREDFVPETAAMWVNFISLETLREFI
jgi:hypothetical protein